MGLTEKELAAMRSGTARFFIERTRNPDEREGWQVTDRMTGEAVGCDGGEPEDQSLVRDWEWVVHALNKVDREQRIERPGRVKASAGGTKRSVICHECGQRIIATIQQAKRHNWLLWVGGALCPRHHDMEVASG